MDLVVNEELKAYIDPLTTEELEALERSLLAEGCRDALVLWGEVLVDGHNRYALCRKHGLPFQTVQATRFQSMEDVHLWMIDQHLGRRSLSEFQRGVLALRKREIVAARRAARSDAQPDPVPGAEAASQGEAGTPALTREEGLQTRESLARAARLRASQIAMIEKIQQSATPELVAAVRSGTLSLNAAAAVATLPAEEQIAASAAGKDELKQAAKRARDAKRKPPREKDEAATADVPADSAAPMPADGHELAALRKRVAELGAENKRLTSENATLRKQVLNLLDRSGGPGAPMNNQEDADAPF